MLWEKLTGQFWSGVAHRCFEQLAFPFEQQVIRDPNWIQCLVVYQTPFRPFSTIDLSKLACETRRVLPITKAMPAPNDLPV